MTIQTDVDYRPAIILDGEREAVSRLVRRLYPDAESILSMLLGSPVVTNQVTRKPPVPLTDAERARMREMRAQGMTHKAIAEEMGSTRTTVARTLRSAS